MTRNDRGGRDEFRRDPRALDPYAPERFLRPLRRTVKSFTGKHLRQAIDPETA